MAEKFCLKWNDFHSNVSKSFSLWRNEDYLQDVTLVGDDHKQILAHKLVLSACSEYFRTIFKNNKHPNPMLCLYGINHQDLYNVMDYIYNGEVQIYQGDLDRFLTIAQQLRLEGLLSNDNNEETKNVTVEDEQEIKKEEIKSRRISVRERQIVREANEYKDTLIAISINQEEIGNLNEKLNENMEKCEDGSYRCKICGKMSGSKNDSRNMRNHIETHMEGLSFTCPICQKSFRSRNSLFKHKSVYHR